MKLKGDKPTEPIRWFANPAAWALWLEKNHRKSARIVVAVWRKKDQGLRSVTYAEALEVALCYGWIDGQKRGESEQAWLQRFLPRSANSIWSKINRDKVIGSDRERPHESCRVWKQSRPPRKPDRWKAAYDSPKGAKVPEDFRLALDANPRAREILSSRSMARIGTRCCFAFRR